MAKRRGFFAELQHQAALAERERQRAHAATAREAAKQQRDAERARAAAARAHTQAVRATTQAKAAAEREAKRLHIEAQEAEVAALNATLASTLADIDSVLEWTLSIDDHVELEQLRQVADHPPFVSSHQAPLPKPAPIEAPPEPVFEEPAAPTGLGAMFSKKKHALAVAEERSRFEQRHAAWRTRAASIPMRQLEQANAHQAAEAQRQANLAADHAVYDAQCQERISGVEADNARLDALISGLQVGDKAAVEEYFAIVFGNSVYPDAISVETELSYTPDARELEVAIGLPAPDSVPAVRAYKYIKARDEITETSQTAKEQRDRYTTLVNAIVLRTLHEVWESDRAGHVDTVALTAAVEHIDPATGQNTATPLVAVAAHREDFEGIDLGRVTPAETLKHLKAVVSKNPHALTPVSLAAGVRK